MESRVLSVCLLLGLMGIGYVPVDAGPSLSFLSDRLTFDPQTTCNIGEVSCSPGCHEVLVCLADNQQIVLSNCTKNSMMCDATTMTCKKNVTTCRSPPDESQFRCHADGIFPNPFDCHSYFECIGNGTSTTTTTTAASTTTTTAASTTTTTAASTTTTTVPTTHTSAMAPATSITAAPPLVDDVLGGISARYPQFGVQRNCTATTAYDPLSTTCRLRESHRVCVEGPVPKCVAPAQNDAQRENPNIYFVCVNDPDTNSLVPWLFKCPKPQQIYKNGHCQ